ncbi:YfzA family protein [Bacillus massiliigorillae]|uniref:YfzA family protein n=1 Tax=Bacillus massiliigorillae TaxID=1243664 RepID=UPI0005A79117|nr:YfzA family protein [Bacillus massiliigorillae]
MADKPKNPIPFFKRPWVSLIGTFLLSQIFFITFEITGWIPNLKDIDGTLFGRIAESSIFREWFSFYETTHFNLFTVFFGIVLLVPGIIGAIKDILSKKTMVS